MMLTNKFKKMSIKKTIGGERLGSGSKRQVDLHGYDRSTHDLGYVLRTTMSAGTLVPFINEVALKGDTWDINIDGFMQTHPTIGPMLGSLKWQFDVFKCPMRLYHGRLHNNETGIGMKMEDLKLPVFELIARTINPEEFTGDYSVSQINPSSVLAHLGLMGIGQTNEFSSGVRKFNAMAWIAYWDAVKNYYTNKQEPMARVIHTAPTIRIFNMTSLSVPAGVVPEVPAPLEMLAVFWGQTIQVEHLAGLQPLNQIMVVMNTGVPGSSDFVIPVSNLGSVISQSATNTQVRYEYTLAGATRFLRGWRYATANDMIMKEIEIQEFELTKLDDIRMALQAWPYAHPTTPFDVTEMEPFSFATQVGAEDFAAIMESQEGLALKTYQSDWFNNWIATESIDGPDGVNNRTRIDTTGGSFTMDTLIFAEKIYKMMNRIAIAGGTYDDWQDAIWGMETYNRTEIPVYVGGLSKEVIFSEVVSLASNNLGGEEGQPLGTLAGRGRLSEKHKGGKVSIKVDEMSIILGIMSLTPRIDYSQGNNWAFDLQTMNDFHKPVLDGIGYQDLVTEQFAWWGTRQAPDGTWAKTSAGKVPAWTHYQTNVNRVRGEFAGSLNWMCFNRRYGWVADGEYMEIEDITQYIDPSKFNYIFASTALDSQNYWAQIGVDITVRRIMSANQIPNL